MLAVFMPARTESWRMPSAVSFGGHWVMEQQGVWQSDLVSSAVIGECGHERQTFNRTGPNVQNTQKP